MNRVVSAAIADAAEHAMDYLQQHIDGIEYPKLAVAYAEAQEFFKEFAHMHYVSDEDLWEAEKELIGNA